MSEHAGARTNVKTFTAGRVTTVYINHTTTTRVFKTLLQWRANEKDFSPVRSEVESVRAPAPN